MWSNFFEAGGWGMYPTLVFGFLLLAASGLHALRRDPRYQRAALALGIVTAASGLLGTSTGFATTVHYAADKVAREEQLMTLAKGFEESIHNLVLALIIVVFAGLIAAGSALRRGSGQS
jgi:hypothetical protein